MADHLPASLARLRKAAGLTQAALADLVNVDRVNITLIEQGKHSPSWALALKLAEVLGCSLDQLAGRARIPKKSSRT